MSVIDFATRKVDATWPIPGGGSPDMGNVSADGKSSGSRVATTTSSMRSIPRPAPCTTIPVGKEPHGLTVWPQPGRYSLGHTGNTR